MFHLHCKILFLRQTGPFKSSSINALAELSQGVREVTYEKGATLWKEGESSGTMLLLVSGRVGVAGRGGSVRFEAGPGFPLGGIETLAGEPRWYTATTKTRLFALELSVEGLIDVLEDNFDMAMDFLAAVSHVTLGLIERIAGSGGEMLGLLTHAAEPAFTNHDAAGERGSGTGE